MKNLEIISFNLATPELQNTIANQMSAYTNQDGLQMLPVEPEQIYGKYTGQAAMVDAKFVGYAGATQPEEWNGKRFSEIGSLYVVEEYRKYGFGSILSKLVSVNLMMEDIVPYAFTNPSSFGLFKKLGFTVADPLHLPPGVFGPCAGCPKNPGNGQCCDIPMIKE